MARKEKLICINCPMGCHLDITIEDNGAWLIKGNQCKRGETYAKTELTNPTRILTTTVKIQNGFLNRLPVRTTKGIPKSKIFEAMKVLNKVCINKPVKVGDTIVRDILGTGVDVIASRSMEVKETVRL